MAIVGLARRRRLPAVAGASALVALVAALLVSGIVGGMPPELRPHHLQTGVAVSHVYVDLPPDTPPLAFRRADPPDDVPTLVKRTELLGRLMVAPPVLERLAARCGIARGDVSGLARTTANVPGALVQPNSERRASDIRASKAPARIEVQSRPTLPVIDVYTQAASVEDAACLAAAAPRATTDHLEALARAGDSPDPVMRLLALGAPRGGVANAGATPVVALLTFFTVFALLAAGLLLVGPLRRGLGSWSRADVEPLRACDAEPASAAPPDPDSWPRTTRILPWMLAAFIALLWLTPFNNIELNASLPVDLQLDRLVLPFILIVWALAIAAGGRLAPRLRLSWVHVALGALLACAFLSVVMDARYLSRSLELDLSLKKLPLLVSYVTLFVVVASSVRRTEVRPFMTYTLVLSVICALGMNWEYRMEQNVFWTLSDALLPGMFRVNGALDGGVLDDIGRRVVRGPAEVPLEAVAMLTMALPIAVVRLMHADRWRERILYAAAIAVIAAATFATYRKSALVAPVAVILTLAYFRRRELLRLAPLGMVLLALVSVVSPGAIGSTVRQFTRADAAAVPTVSDRAADYDAVRPDLLSHLILGRGWGSYNHASYRILDSEILSRTIETGLVGLVAFLFVGVSLVVASRRAIASRDPASAPIALIGASVAAAFLVLATLFDELSFPHPVYIFLYMAALVTVAVRHSPRPTQPRRAPPRPDPAPPALEVPALEAPAEPPAQAPPALAR